MEDFPQSQHTNRRCLTVSELTYAIKDLLEGTYRIIYVRGELSSLMLHPSRHVYFTLKDSQCQINGAAWNFVERAKMLGLAPGMEVEITGCISVYTPKGSYQIVARDIRPAGQGELFRQLQELKARLSLEGLFDATRKRPIPLIPKTIGLITGATAAAYRDFIENVRRRFGGVHVLFYPVTVQGADAPRSIITALDYFNRTRTCDVIVLTRGGGASEDLGAFNDEALVRKVASSQIPVISAVGHQRDESLCDLAADFAAATPTHAAQVVVYGRDELIQRLENASMRLLQATRLKLSTLSQRIQRAASCRYLQHPQTLANELTQRLDFAMMRLQTALPSLASRSSQVLSTLSLRLQNQRKVISEIRTRRLDQLQAKLEAMNPKKVLERGYAILIDKHKRAVVSARETSPGDTLTGILHDGEISLEITKK